MPQLVPRQRVNGGGKGSETLVARDSGGAYGDADQTAVYEPFTKETGIRIEDAA
ncbi:MULTISPECIES: hypothetical protein [unclassified Streptomyces]|uniref:hypothetical protein n=1 Tax=unclassified Streptomyces TaxID=2593676 RepID=UPI002B1E8B34|nr:MULTISPECIES: hypothetical protein [unclassified Streptomyces]